LYGRYFSHDVGIAVGIIVFSLLVVSVCFDPLILLRSKRTILYGVVQYSTRVLRVVDSRSNFVGFRVSCDLSGYESYTVFSTEVRTRKQFVGIQCMYN
jgi:hypothetical protein